MSFGLLFDPNHKIHRSKFNGHTVYNSFLTSNIPDAAHKGGRPSPQLRLTTFILCILMLLSVSYNLWSKHRNTAWQLGVLPKD